ncbi:MAG: FHA domain-containing protein [Pseudomonadota bacterium]
MARVKICPSCDRENPPTIPFCACGASLATTPKVDARSAKPSPVRAATIPTRDGPIANIRLLWPWGEQRLPDALPIGRDPDFSPISEHLGAYDNISRRHAELRREGLTVWIEDLGSTNGTFVDEQRLVPHQPWQVEGNFTLRLARDLKVRVETREET